MAGMTLPRVVTIGVYGFDEPAFLAALQRAGVDTFCDLRRRRGLRGKAYAFANSTRLQESLQALGIRYLHLPEYAPSEATIKLQHQIDAASGAGMRGRKALSPAFLAAYDTDVMARFDSRAFVDRLGPEAKTVALFCVEGEPRACHRSLLADRLARDLGLTVEHLTP